MIDRKRLLVLAAAAAAAAVAAFLAKDSLRPAEPGPAPPPSPK
jgi:hypothetical protein